MLIQKTHLTAKRREAVADTLGDDRVELALRLNGTLALDFPTFDGGKVTVYLTRAEVDQLRAAMGEMEAELDRYRERLSVHRSAKRTVPNEYNKQYNPAPGYTKCARCDGAGWMESEGEALHSCTECRGHGAIRATVH